MSKRDLVRDVDDDPPALERPWECSAAARSSGSSLQTRRRTPAFCMAKRLESTSSEVATHTLDNTTKLKVLIEANTTLTQQVRGRVSADHRQTDHAPPCFLTVDRPCRLKQAASSETWGSLRGPAPRRVSMRSPSPVHR